MTELPASFSFAALFVAEADGEPVGGVTLSLIDPKGAVLLERTMSFDFSQLSSVPAALNVNVCGNSDLGLWRVAFINGDRVIGELPFELVLKAP